MLDQTLSPGNANEFTYIYFIAFAYEAAENEYLFVHALFVYARACVYACVSICVCVIQCACKRVTVGT